MAKSKWDWDAFRLAVIEAGIRGELTSEWRLENPNTEPAHILLDRIAEEKAELVRTKQIKKEKPLPPVSDDDAPFEIPEGWEWTRIIEVAQIIPGFSFKASEYQAEGVRVIRISDFDEFEFNNKETVRYRFFDKMKKYQIFNGDILVPMTGSIGKNHFVQELPESDCYLNQRIAILRSILMSARYNAVVLQSNLTISRMRGAMKSTNGNISKGDIENTLVPLPPLEEQKEIVRILDSLNGAETSIDELHPVVARIKSLERNFMALAKEFENQEKRLEQLRTSLLQEAISGQMTAEWRLKNPNTEPAHTLLDRIAEEKAELVRTKQIKKEKPLPPVSRGDLPFAIPKCWEWARVGEVCSHNAGKTLHKGSNSGLPYDCLTTSNVYWNHFNLDDVKTVLLEEKELGRCLARKGDLLVLEGGDVGRAAIWQETYTIAIQNHLHRIRPLKGVSTEFLWRCFMELYFSNRIKRYKKGMGIGNLSGKALSSIIVPLPPLEEQKEIVRQLEVKLNAVQGLQDRLNEDLETAQTLLKAKLKEVFEKTDVPPTVSLSHAV